MKLKKKDWLTLGNAASGFLAIVAATNYWTWLPFALICLAVVFDALDGRAARRSKPNAFGMHLDSLADAVSFGVAPAFIVFKAFAGFYSGAFALLFLAASVAYACATLVRLARFNETKGRIYRGLPSPAAAITVLAACYIAPALSPVWLLTSGALMLASFKVSKPRIA